MESGTLISLLTQCLVEVELELERTTMMKLMELLERVETIMLSGFRVKGVLTIVILLPFFCRKTIELKYKTKQKPIGVFRPFFFKVYLDQLKLPWLQQCQ